jgi:hypothetical protein
MVMSILLLHLITFSPLSAQTVKRIMVSADSSYTDHISLENDVTDKDIMVKFVFDEAANQLSVSLISHRMIFVFREDVRYKPLIKGRKIRPDQLPYVVTYDPSEKYMISKLFRQTVPKPRKQYVFHRWIDYEGIQPVPQEYKMTNDYISQTFDILQKRTSVVVRIRDVMLINDISKHMNKRRYEIPFGRDLYTEYQVEILRNPCFGQDEDIASAKTALENISKSYKNVKKRFGHGVVTSEENLNAFQELKEMLQKQFPHKDVKHPCSNVQRAWDSYNAYVDSIAGMKCKLQQPREGLVAQVGGVSAKVLLARAKQIDEAVARWLLSSDPIERRDIILQTEGTIKTMNEEVTSQGIYTAEQRQALAVFRKAENYFKNSCKRIY